MTTAKEIGTDFSGVGAAIQAMLAIKEQRKNTDKPFDFREAFACDKDKWARMTYVHNYGDPEDFPEDVYDRAIPKNPLDFYLTSPPCQAFSMAGNRKGKADPRGILFFNSHEFIQKNRPKKFLFENVKGLLADDDGRTFQEWINMLGGKSVNGVPVIFPHEDAVPYHIYWKVLNATDFNVPQNRERVFIVGIRDDEDNTFSWPREMYLTKRLQDVLEDEVDEKYILSEKAIAGLLKHKEGQKEKGNGFGANIDDGTGVSHTIKARYHKDGSDQLVRVGTWRTHKDGRGFRESESGHCPTIPARGREDGSGQPVLLLKMQRTEAAKDKRRESLRAGKDTGSFSEREAIFVDQPFADTIVANPKHEGIIYDPEAVIIQRGHGHNEGGIHKNAPSITTRTWNANNVLYFQEVIRRLTPRECFRLMGFPDSFSWPVSDSQAYKQAGNSIVVDVLIAILSKLL